MQDADEVMMEIAPQVKEAIHASETSKIDGQSKDDILELMGSDALSIDDIAHELGIDVAEVAKRLSMMELKGEVVRIEGNRFLARSLHG